MAKPDPLTITVAPADAEFVREVVARGDYASAGEVVSQALREWQTRHAARRSAFEALRSDIETGMADVAAGRLHAFDIDRIVERGRRKLADRARSD